MTTSRRIAVVIVALVLVVPLALIALLALIVVPSRAGVETFCLLSETSDAADVYMSSFEVVIVMSAVVTVGIVVGYVKRIGWPLFASPLAWFGAVLLAEYLVALAIGPQSCQGGIGI